MNVLQGRIWAMRGPLLSPAWSACSGGDTPLDSDGKVKIPNRTYEKWKDSQSRGASSMPVVRTRTRTISCLEGIKSGVNRDTASKKLLGTDGSIRI